MTTIIENSKQVDLTTSVRVMFDRIGRDHAVPWLDIRFNGDADMLAEAIYKYARPRLGSKDVEVEVDLEEMTGLIYCGWHVGGRFTIEHTSPEVWL